jgi:hypothetical protein
MFEKSRRERVILAGKFAPMRFTLLPQHTFRLPDRLRDPSPSALLTVAMKAKPGAVLSRFSERKSETKNQEARPHGRM